MSTENENRNPQLQEGNSKLGLIILLLLVFGIPLIAILYNLFFGEPAK